MPDFSHSLRQSIEADARDNLGAQALPGTRRTISRRRRTAAAGYGAGSALAVGAVAVAGVTLTGRGDPAPASAVSPSPTSEAPIAYATLDLPSYDRFADADPLCGQPVPQPTTESDIIHGETTLVVDDHRILEQDHEAGQVALAEVELTAADDAVGDERVQVMFRTPQALLAKDGVVVGMAHGMEEDSVAIVTDTWTARPNASWYGGASACDDFGDGGQLPAGDYELVVVTRVTATEQQAAEHALRMENFRLPHVEALDLLRPGSYDCQRESMYGGTVPLSCDVDGVPGASIDLEDMTATVPYPSEYFTREVDATIVSETVPVTLTERAPEGGGAPPEAERAFTASDVAVCGDMYGWADASETRMTLTQGLNLEAGDVVAPTVWVDGDTGPEATVDLPDAARLWVTSTTSIDSEDGMSSWHARQIVGWIDVTASSAAPVTISRYDGPEPWEFTVQDVSWCGGEPPTTIADGAWMIAPHTITDQNGTRPGGEIIEVTRDGW